ncbi:MAG: AAA family ATPase [Gammaproteobacteria bacterium]|nr:AAA family ATPase [Gammaproteobacteria bacterium]
MYTSFFGLNEKPFSITPDPRYLFMSERHGEALAHLVYGVTESGGFIQLTGEVGTGKTTLVRTLLLNRMPENADVAVVLNPQLSVLEFLATICEELHIEVAHNKGSIKAQTDALNRHLLQAHADGRRTILVVDEAQNLSPAVLEQVRLLTNLETAKQKLLQIILIGQPELRELLARNDLRQLAQRITGRYHLEPLSRDETAQYIEHRLKVAGAVGEVFDSGAKKETFRLSQGVPRLINVICDRALLGAYSRESRRVDRRLIRRAAAEVRGQVERSPWLRPIAAAAGIAGVTIIAMTIWSGMQTRGPSPPAVAAVPDEAPMTEADRKAEPSQATANQSPPDAEIAAEAEPEIEAQLSDVEPTLDEQLQMATDLTSTPAALSTLFDVWGLTFDPVRSGCSQAADFGLACLYQRGSWASLRQMDRPTMLTLVDETGASHQVVLTAIHDGAADLSIGGVLVTHPVEAITNAWFGQYMLLWRPPGGSAVSLGPDSRGADVLWLRESLAAIDEEFATGNPNSDLYDAELEQTVRAFQRAHRLDVDGLAGQQTQIVINSLLTVDGTPRLSSALLVQE